MRLLTSRWTLLGFFGSLLIAIGGWLTSYLPYEILVQLGTTRAMWRVGVVFFLVGMAMLSVGFMQLRPNHAKIINYAEYLPVLIVWCLPLMLCPPLLSRDVWAYMDQAWIVYNHYDPYLMSMGSLHGPFEQIVDSFWVGQTTVYTPLMLRMQQLMIMVGGLSILGSMFALKIPVLVSMAVYWFVLPRLAATYHVSRRWAVWFGMFNPMLLVHLVGGMHNDAIMIACAMLALWLATHKHGLITGAIAAGIAGGFKQQGLWAAVAVALIAAGNPATWPRRIKLIAVAVGIATVTFIATCLVCGWSFSLHGFGWMRGSGTPASVPTLSVVSIISQIFAPLHIRVFTPLSIIALLILAGLLTWIVRRYPDEPIKVAAWGWLALCLCLPGMQPWYLVLGLLTLAATRIPSKFGAIIAGWVVMLLFANWFSDALRLNLLLGSFIGLGLAVPTYLVWKRHWPAAVE